MLESDYAYVIEASPKEPIFSRQGSIIFEIQRLLSYFEKIIVLYIGRQGNEDKKISQACRWKDHQEYKG